MFDDNDKPASAETGCLLGVILLVIGILIGALWSGRGTPDRIDSIERSQEWIRARLYQIEKKLEAEDTVDE